METKPRMLIAACLIVTSVGLASCAPRTIAAQPATEAQPQRGPEMMRGMGDNPMMAQCQNMMRTPIYPDSPCGIFALRESLGLSEEQAKKLAAIEDTARAEARKVLTDEQCTKFEELTKDWKPQSMMQGMQAMMPQMQKMMGGQMPPCPMMQMMQGK